MFDKNPGGLRLFVIQLVFLILSWIFTLLRGWVKVVIIRKVTLDDYLMFAATLMYTAYGIIAMNGIVEGGTGKHVTDLTLQGAATALKAWWLCEVLYPPVVLLVRTSVAVFLLRIATRKLHRWIICIDITLTIVITGVFFFLMVFQCSPVSYFWMQVLGEPGKCMDRRVVPAATIVHSVTSAISDFVLALLPIAMLWDVKLNKRTKVTISFLLSLGLLAGVALIVRIPYVRVLEISIDFLFETIDVAIWSVMEPSLGIIAGCAATLRPLFKTWGLGPKTRLLRRGQHGYHSRSRSGGNEGWPSSHSQRLQKMSNAVSSSGSRTILRDEHDDTRSDVELAMGPGRLGRPDRGFEETGPHGKIEAHGFDVSSRPRQPARSHSSAERFTSWQQKQLPAIPSVAI